MTSYADVAPLPIVYLDLPGAMAGRIPRSDVTLWTGEGSAGKGTTLVWMAVATALQGHHAALVLPEDDPETAVRPRLDAALHALAGDLADDPDYARDVLSRVHDLTVSEGGAPFVLDATGKTAGSIPALNALVRNPTGCECPPDDPSHRHPVVRFVAIDPLLACLEGSVATNIGARRVLGPLTAMAKDTGAAVVLSQHTVPGPGGKPKVAGSQGLVDTVRLCYMIVVDRFNAELRIVRTHKANGARPEDVRFTLTTQPNGCKSVTWLDQEELMVRRTAWRQEPEPEPVAPADPVMAWLEQGGGSVASCVAATGLDEGECLRRLAALQAQGVVRPPKRRWRR